MIKKSLICLFALLTSLLSIAQNTYVVVLDDHEVLRLRTLMKSDNQIKMLGDSILAEGKKALAASPNPVDTIYYEGLLDTNPRRIETSKSLNDMNLLTNLIYSGYIEKNDQIGAKVKEFVMAWSSTYLPNGNPINENKFVALFWSYYLYRDHFDANERKTVDHWMRAIANTEMGREHTPNNNWQAKRLKIIGIIGCLLKDESLQQFSIDGFKDYINTSYFPDGTSVDLRDRDALQYHLSGLKPCISAFINLSKFNHAFSLYDYEAPSGSSIKKSIEYAIPYAKGEKQHKEWINSKVKLDHERAAAGIEKYQPGILFDPATAIEALEWAGYYNPELLDIINKGESDHLFWVGLLNCDLIRKK